VQRAARSSVVMSQAFFTSYNAAAALLAAVVPAAS
jgi:hypothetical protein